ncbi:ABC transporter permease subunit [uncultured Clostridium sp.]|uniref:ABC transporter permease subunit n=1 Tax=uncultured Clostridium sp. TaxID=59620 RepID=UPI0025EF9F93|nr:ABC transporter permease subunit [uncultured Clostridium sp.]
MSRLIYAGIFRLKKSNLFKWSLTSVLLYTIFVYGIQYYRMPKNEKIPFDSFLFFFLLIIGIVTAMFVSSFIGKEYSDGTIRNKLIVGLSRKSIYLSNLIICIIAEIIIVVANYIIGSILGFVLFGYLEMSLSKLMIMGLVGVLLSIAYVSIFYMITMISSSKTRSANICLTLASFIIIASIMLFNRLATPEYIEKVKVENQQNAVEMIKNPSYISGTKRKVYETILYFLPNGQVMSIFNERGTNYVTMMVYSTMTVVFTTAVGTIIFCRKDIK